MSDPKRWRELAGGEGREEGESVETQRVAAAFVTFLAQAEPSARTREDLWAKIVPTLPPIPGGEGPGGGEGGGGSGGGGAGLGAGGAGGIGAGAGLGAKLLVPLIGVAIAAGVAGWLLSSSASAPSTSSTPPPTATHLASSIDSRTSAVAAAPDPAQPTAAAPYAPASAAPASGTQTPSAVVGAHPRAATTTIATNTSAPSRPANHAASQAADNPAPSAPHASPSTLAADRLREEADGVRKARQLLREKNASAALAELDRLAKLVPNGPLEEEREVLTIEALSASGSSDAARRRADRFLFERPQCVHASRVRELAGR
jgi:hypothetical protein